MRNFVIICLLLAGCASVSPVPVIVTEASDMPCVSLTPLITLPHDDLDPVWSPDGNRLAFLSHVEGNPEIYVAHWGEDNRINYPTNLSNAPDEDDYMPRWSPDGRYVAWLNRKQPYVWRPVQIRIAEVATGEVQIAAPGYETRWMLGWSTDNQSLIYRQDDRFYAYDVAARSTRLLFEAPTGFYTAYHMLSPDGAWLLIGTYTSAGRASGYRIQTATGEAMELDALANQYVTKHQWSPDGRSVALLFTGQAQFWVLDIASGSITILNERDSNGDGVQAFGWSDYGRLAWAFWRDVESVPHSVVNVTDVVSGETRELFTINHHVAQIVWSPTENVLAFRTYAGLYVADPDSGVFSELAQGIGRLGELKWSPDGRQIAAGVDGLRMNFFYGTVIVDVTRGGQLFYGGTGAYTWSPIADRLLVTHAVNQPYDVYELNFCD